MGQVLSERINPLTAKLFNLKFSSTHFNKILIVRLVGYMRRLILIENLGWCDLDYYHNVRNSMLGVLEE